MTKYDKYELKSYPAQGGDAMTSAMNDIMIDEYRRGLRDRDDRIAELRKTIDAISADNVKLHTAFEILRPQADLQIENARLQAENASLRAALDAVEWLRVYDSMFHHIGYYCPWCKKQHLIGEPDNHKTDCQRQIALGLVKP